jgi:ubiquinone/menaquinone biosynthesis C-methylase UbiE
MSEGCLTMTDRSDGTEDADRIKSVYRRRRSMVDPARYSVSRPGNMLAIEERERILRAGLARRGMARLHDLDVVEIGCGTGAELERFVALGADVNRLHGIDLLEASAAIARSRVPDAIIVVGDATRLPYPDATFDVTYQATALSSMPSAAMRAAVAAEMRRVTRPGGVIISYDFVWNPTNPDTVGISRRELQRLFPTLPLEIHRVTLLPPLGRWLGDRSIRLTRLAASVPFLKSHRLAFIDVVP